MPGAESAWGVLKSIVLYQETIRAVRGDVTALVGDVAALSRAHADLRDRVSRLEGIIEGAAIVARQRRIEG